MLHFVLSGLRFEDLCAVPLVYLVFNLLAPELFFIFYFNVNNTGTKYVRIMKHTAFKKNGDYIPCLKYSVPVFVE